jgi:hypothetical protein
LCWGGTIGVLILPKWEAPTMPSPSVATILRDHVSLSTACIDRLYLNGYVPRLQSTGQLCAFLCDHLGNQIPSPAAFRPLHDRFVQAVAAFARQHCIPVVPFERGQRKDDVAARYRARFHAAECVVFIGVAQERQFSFKATKHVVPPRMVRFSFARQSVAVKHYYFYLHDAEWGPAFIKIGTYLPYPVRVCLNGNEWLKQQLRKEDIAFDSLDNGFLWCADPDRLQQLADSLSPTDVEAFFDRWLQRLPWPLTWFDRAAGYRHRLSIWQLEMSLTQVFTTPIHGRHFFEAVIRNNLDLGRPDRVSLLFPTRLRRNTRPPDLGYKTRVITHGVAPSLHVEFKHSHVKQYFKQERALRTETTINDPLDFQRTKALDTLPHLRAIGRQINTRLLEVERMADGVLPAASLFERLQLPMRSPTGQRVSALRFGDPRSHALFGALCRFSHLPDGFRHRDLRPLVAALLGRELASYSAGSMTYDLRRLRLHGMLKRAPGTQRYSLTLAGARVAFLYTTLYRRLRRQPTAETQYPPHLPSRLDAALHHLDIVLQELWSPPKAAA